MKKSELPELLKEKEELLKRVAQIDSIVPHLKAECATKMNELDKDLFDWYISQRSIEYPTKQDMAALCIQLEKRGLTEYTPDDVLKHWKEKKQEGHHSKRGK